MILIDDMEALYKKRFYYVCDNYELFTDKSKYLMDATEEAFVDICLWGFDTASRHDYGHKEFSRIVTSRDEITLAIDSAAGHVRCNNHENENVFLLEIASRVYPKADFYFYLDSKNVLWFKVSKKHTREPIKEKKLGVVGGSYDDAFTYNVIHQCVHEFLGYMVKVALDQ